jgi:hypothetical protein
VHAHNQTKLPQLWVESIEEGRGREKERQIAEERVGGEEPKHSTAKKPGKSFNTLSGLSKRKEGCYVAEIE